MEKAVAEVKNRGIRVIMLLSSSVITLIGEEKKAVWLRANEDINIRFLKISKSKI